MLVPGKGRSFGYDVPIDCLEVWHGPARSFDAVTLDAWDGLVRSGGRVVAAGVDAQWIEPEVAYGGRIYGPGDVAPSGPVDVRVRGEVPDGVGARLATASGEVDGGELDLARHGYVRAEVRRDGDDDPFPLAVLTDPVRACRAGAAES